MLNDEMIISQSVALSIVHIGKVRELADALKLNRSEVMRLAIDKLYAEQFAEQKIEITPTPESK